MPILYKLENELKNKPKVFKLLNNFSILINSDHLYIYPRNCCHSVLDAELQSTQRS